MIIVPWSTRTKEYEPFRISAFMNHKSKLLSFGLLNAVAAFPSLAIAGGSDRPNIILIMVDDMGYSDLGIYGSEIETPNLDRLAREGIRFREFYNNSISAPTRASLITGQYSHSAGIGYFNVNLGQPGYQGFLNRESLTFGEVLREAGYNTFLSGKWHVGNDSICWPAARGFDRSYGFISGASNYYDAGEYASDAPSAYGNTVSLVKDNQRTTLEPGRYLTNAITDNALEFIDQREKDQPFFLYLAFNAPHWPLQAPTEDIAKYKGRYAKGWDALREERIARQKELGILTPGQTIAERDPDVPLWENLTFEQKELWQKKMEIYAAMVDRVDQNIGRIIEKHALAMAGQWVPRAHGNTRNNRGPTFRSRRSANTKTIFMRAVSVRLSSPGIRNVSRRDNSYKARDTSSTSRRPFMRSPKPTTLANTRDTPSNPYPASRFGLSLKEKNKSSPARSPYSGSGRATGPSVRDNGSSSPPIPACNGSFTTYRTTGARRGTSLRNTRISSIGSRPNISNGPKRIR